MWSPSSERRPAVSDGPADTLAVRAARGSQLRCRGWRQEALLRLLENTIENGDHPEDLII